jgi:hypothetical protein
MNRHHRIIISVITLAMAAVSFAPLTAFAAAPPAGEALEIAPPVLNIKANPGDIVKTTINLRDVSTSPLVVRNQINDFVAAGEDGTPKSLRSSQNK